MAKWVLSEKADADLIDLYVYGYGQFGEAQTERYIDQLENTFANLADQPKIGRPVIEIDEAIFRFFHGVHAIYYREHEGGGILILRIREARADPQRQLQELGDG